VENKRKSTFLTFFLSMMPGAGHFYLGLMNRGLQLMLVFMGGIVTIVILGIPELAPFLPVVWFYSLFDALQMTEAINAGKTVEDSLVLTPKHKIKTEKYTGWALIIIGSLLVFKKILPELAAYFMPGYLFLNTKIQTALIAFALIIIGIRILRPSYPSAKDQPQHKTIDALQIDAQQDEKVVGIKGGSANE
jgi:hypothetical protein